MMKIINKISENWYFIIFICLQSHWFITLHVFEDQIIIYFILNLMRNIGIGGSITYLLFQGLEERRKREAMRSEEVAEKL